MTPNPHEWGSTLCILVSAEQVGDKIDWQSNMMIAFLIMQLWLSWWIVFWDGEWFLDRIKLCFCRMNGDCEVVHGKAHHCIASNVIHELEPWKLNEIQFGIWQYRAIVNGATLRGLWKYAQIGTSLSLLMNRALNARNTDIFDLGKYGERRTNAMQLSCRRFCGNCHIGEEWS